MDAKELLEIQGAFDKSVDRMFTNFKDEAFDPLRVEVGQIHDKVSKQAERLGKVEQRVETVEGETRTNRKSLWALLVMLLTAALGAAWSLLGFGQGGR